MSIKLKFLLGRTAQCYVRVTSLQFFTQQPLDCRLSVACNSCEGPRILSTVSRCCVRHMCRTRWREGSFKLLNVDYQKFSSLDEYPLLYTSLYGEGSYILIHNLLEVTHHYGMGTRSQSVPVNQLLVIKYCLLSFSYYPMHDSERLFPPY